MRNNILSKDEFITVMNNWKDTTDYQDKLNNLFSEYCEGWLFQPDCSVGLLYTLEVMFQDQSHWIDYFVHELDFGKKYTEGMVTESDGSPIPLGTIEELYDLLIKEMNNNGK